MEEATLRRIDEFWARRLGCEEAKLRAAGLHVLAQDRAAPPHVFLLSREDTLIMRGEPQACAALTAALRDRPSLPSVTTVAEVLGPRIDRIVGPAFLGYRAAPPALPEGAGEVRVLGAADRSALARLHDAVTDEEWEHAGIQLEDPSARVVGAFEEDRLLAAAGFETLLERVAHGGVVSHPKARRRGAGRRAAAAAASAGAERGFLLQYQTLEANQPSMRIATVLGFERYAASLAVRIAA